MALPPTLKSGYRLWYYYPSVPGAVVVAVIFAALALVHCVFIMKTRKRFCIPLLIGAIFELAGYAFRVRAHTHITSLVSYAGQSMLILLAPILFAASVYMYLARVVISVHGERHSIIPVQFLTKIFVCGDVLCFCIQGGGGGLMAALSSARTVGERMILAGMILQIIIFLFFVATAWIWHVRMRREKSSSLQFGHYETSWQYLIVSLYIISVLITFRNIIRTIEYGMGASGYLLTHEWVIFVFDAVPMMFVLAISAVWYRTDIGRRRTLPEPESLQEIPTEMTVFVK
ncbi:RTA1-domain-containing protein [Limtongia smithiae]|uniref:RTA1-domain-containing protein n=1 Tax=Limtongia smithiae TaxID=1125753 RepID=UPI0034CE7828